MKATDVRCEIIEILEVLKHAGIKAGDAVLDFGCGPGDYAIPAAVLVGKEGVVYALDTDKRKLGEVKEKAVGRDLENILMLSRLQNGSIGMKEESLNVVLLFDILHRYYFPSEESRSKVLRDVYRLLKPGALLLVHPTHIDQSKLTGEIVHAGFEFRDKITGNLIHDGNRTKSSILAFRRFV